MIKNRYERNLPTLVTFYTLSSIYNNFSDGFPDEISKKIVKY